MCSMRSMCASLCSSFSIFGTANRNRPNYQQVPIQDQDLDAEFEAHIGQRGSSADSNEALALHSLQAAPITLSVAQNPPAVPPTPSHRVQYEYRHPAIQFLRWILAFGAVSGISALTFFFAINGAVVWGVPLFVAQIISVVVMSVMFIAYWASWGVKILERAKVKTVNLDPRTFTEAEKIDAIELSPWKKNTSKFFAYGFGLFVACGGYLGWVTFVAAFPVLAPYVLVFQIFGVFSTVCMTFVLGNFMQMFQIANMKKYEYSKGKDLREWNLLKPEINALFLTDLNSLSMTPEQRPKFSTLLGELKDAFDSYQIQLNSGTASESIWEVVGEKIARLTEKSSRYMNAALNRGEALGGGWETFAKHLARIDELYEQRFKYYQSLPSEVKKAWNDLEASIPSVANEDNRPLRDNTFYQTFKNRLKYYQMLASKGKYRLYVKARVDKIKDRAMRCPGKTFGIVVGFLAGVGFGIFKYTSTEEFFLQIGLSGPALYSVVGIGVGIMTIATWLTTAYILWNKFKEWRERVNAGDAPENVVDHRPWPKWIFDTVIIYGAALINCVGPVISLFLQFHPATLAAQLSLVAVSLVFLAAIRFAEYLYTNGPVVEDALANGRTLLGQPKLETISLEVETPTPFLYRTFPMLLAYPSEQPQQVVVSGTMPASVTCDGFLSDRQRAFTPSLVDYPAMNGTNQRPEFLPVFEPKSAAPQR